VAPNKSRLPPPHTWEVFMKVFVWPLEKKRRNLITKKGYKDTLLEGGK
jgi:hypothetical protein